MDLAAELSRRVVVLDGGLATELERRGHDLSSALWSARLLRRSVALAREAGTQWVAASVGPYGAVLADGSEYRGDYGLTAMQLREWHRRRLAVLADAGADVLAVETIPCLAEVEALCIELGTLGVPAWLSVTCTGTSTRAGEPAGDAFAMARDCDAVVAVGVNCVAPDDVTQLTSLAAQVGGKPVVVYPNSGECWDAARRAWTGARVYSRDAVAEWIDAGAALVGGCCRIGPEDIADVRTLAVERGAG